MHVHLCDNNFLVISIFSGLAETWEDSPVTKTLPLSLLPSHQSSVYYLSMNHFSKSYPWRFVKGNVGILSCQLLKVSYILTKIDSLLLSLLQLPRVL